MSYRTFSLTRERWVPCTMIPLWLDSSMALPTNWQPGQSPAMWKCRGYFPARPCWPPFVTLAYLTTPTPPEWATT